MYCQAPSLVPVQLCIVLLASPVLQYLFPLPKWGSETLQETYSDEACEEEEEPRPVIC